MQVIKVLSTSLVLKCLCQSSLCARGIQKAGVHGPSGGPWPHLPGRVACNRLAAHWHSRANTLEAMNGCPVSPTLELA